MIHLEIVPAKVKELAEKAAIITKAIEADLNTGVVKAAAAYIPEGEAAREALIALCEGAIHGCTVLENIADSKGVKGRLQRLMADITAILHDNDHSITHYIVWCEIVFNHLFGKTTD
jgi:hypothetical protein